MVYKPTSNAPLTKVSAGGAAGSFVLIVVWLLGTYGHVEVPANVASGLTLLFTLVASYLVPLLPGEIQAFEQRLEQLQAASGTIVPADAALHQARAASEMAEDAHGRIDELTKQFAEKLGEGPGLG